MTHHKSMCINQSNEEKMSTLQPRVHKSQEPGHLGDHILYGGI